MLFGTIPNLSAESIIYESVNALFTIASIFLGSAGVNMILGFDTSLINSECYSRVDKRGNRFFEVLIKS